MTIIGGTNVPSQYVANVQAAAKKTGLPAAVVAAQINNESGFNPGAVSPAGAQGIAQFLPSTFRSYGKGSPFNAQNAFDAYSNYMSALLKQFHGNISDALAAYNAGPGNLPAGRGYANTILSNAKVSNNATANAGTRGSNATGTATGSSATGSTGTTSAPSSGELGSLLAPIRQLLHGVATVIDYSFTMFEPGQGFRVLFGALALVTAFLSYKVLASAGGSYGR